MSANSTSPSSIPPMALYRKEDDYWKSHDQAAKVEIPYSINRVPSPTDLTAWIFDVRVSSYDAGSGEWSPQFKAKLTIPGDLEKEVWVFTRSDFQLGKHTFQPQVGHIGHINTYSGKGTIWVERQSLDEYGDTIHVRVSNTDMTSARRMLLSLAGRESTSSTGSRGRETIGPTMFKGSFGTVRRVYQQLEHADPSYQSVAMGLTQWGIRKKERKQKGGGG